MTMPRRWAMRVDPSELTQEPRRRALTAEVRAVAAKRGGLDPHNSRVRYVRAGKATPSGALRPALFIEVLGE